MDQSIIIDGSWGFHRDPLFSARSLSIHNLCGWGCGADEISRDAQPSARTRGGWILPPVSPRAGPPSVAWRACSARHLPAFLGTAPAGIRTPLAVLRLVLAALGGTPVARLGTGPADGRGEARAPAHVTGAGPA